MLALGALIASILAVGAGSTAAQPAATSEAAPPDNNPEWGAPWSACVGAAGSHDAMFSDVGDGVIEELRDAISCIGYYGITVGMGDGTYAPDANVSAFEMGLFVERMADRMGADADAVLGGVMLSDPVTRLEMAQLMFGLVNDISDDVRISPVDGQIESYNYDSNSWDVVNDFFADVKLLEPIRESQIVGATYELGITKGRSANVSTADSVFAPSDPVTRAEMAAFIARTLDHSNLRPEGLSFQRNNSGDSMVSVRDGEFEPVWDARIDVFSALYPDDAFDEDGECVLRFVKDETPSHSVCAIDIGDQQTTDDLGNVEFTLASESDPITSECSVGGTDPYVFSAAAGSEGRTFWAWSGELDDEVNEDTDLVERERVDRPVGAAGPDYLRITGGLPTDDEVAKMGEAVTFTAQLYSIRGANGRDGATLIDDVPAGPDRSGNYYLVKIEKYRLRPDGAYAADGTAGTPTDSDSSASGGTADSTFLAAPGDWDFVNRAGTAEVATRPEGLSQTVFDSVRWPNSDGEFTITLDNLDAFAAPPNDDPDIGVLFTVTPFPVDTNLLKANLVTDIVIGADTHYAVAAAGSATGHVIFSDDGRDPHNVKGESASYRIIAGGRTGNSVTVTVLDQYGDPMRNVDISVTSNLDDADRATDQVVFPEQVDITVQANEDGNGDGTRDTATDSTAVNLVNPTTTRTALTNNAVATVEAAAIAASAATTPVSDQTRVRTVTVPIQMFSINNNRAVVDGTTVVTNPRDDAVGSLRTRGNGAYRIGYSYIDPSSANAQTEVILPQSNRIVRLFLSAQSTDGATAATTWSFFGGEFDSERNPVNTVNTGTANEAAATIADATVTAAENGSPVYVRWAKLGVNGQSDTSTGAGGDGVGGDPEFVDIFVRDVASRTLVVHDDPAAAAANATAAADTTAVADINTAIADDEPTVYFYDEDDVFIIDNQGATFEMFEEALGLNWIPDGIYADEISWENYTLTRAGNARPGRVDRTIWEITLQCSSAPPIG